MPRLKMPGCCACSGPPFLVQRATWDSPATDPGYASLVGYPLKNISDDYGGTISRSEGEILSPATSWEILSVHPNYVKCGPSDRATTGIYRGLGVWAAWRKAFSGISTNSKMRIHNPAEGWLGYYSTTDHADLSDLVLVDDEEVAPPSDSFVEFSPSAPEPDAGKIGIEVALFFFGITDAGDLPATIPNSFLDFTYP